MLFLNPEIYREIWIQAEANNVDPYLIAAIMKNESDFNPLAVDAERQGFGLMQLDLRGAGAGHLPTELLGISRNLELAVRFLRSLIAATPTYADAVSAYNQGLTGWRNNGQSFNATYVNNVMDTYKKLLDEGMSRMEHPDLNYRWG